MKKIIALLACLWALCAGATNITNYPVRTTFNANYWFLLSDVAAQTNWNLPGNYVASTSDLNNLSNIVMNISNFTSITVTNPITNLSLTANTVLEADANKAIASIPNGTGLLANNGLGGFSWISVSSFLTNAPWDSITNYIDGNLSQVWSNTTSGSYSIVTTNLDITHTNGSDYRNTVGGNVDVSGTYTSASATANTISKWDANKALASVANGTGLLTNSGGGTFGWLPLSDLTNFSSSVTISNVYIRFATISNLIVLSNAYFLGTNFFDTITVTNPITNLSLTANTIVKSDANQALASVPNGTGALTNDGAGVFGWGTLNLPFLPLAGGTETGPVLSSSITTNAPANNEFPVAGWVRKLFNNGIIDYVTTNIDSVATNLSSGQPVYTFATDIPPVSSRTYTAPNTGDYIGSVITTNSFLFLQGPINVSSYLAALGGSGNPSVSMHPEIYYSYDKTNWLGDWEAQNQTITIGATNLYQFVISFPSITATNNTGFYIQRRMKIGAAAGATKPNVVILVGTNSASGTNDASHIAFSGPNSAVFNQTYFPTQYVGVSFTTNLYVQQTKYYTNSGTMAPDFSHGYDSISTNASFTFLDPINTEASGTFVETTVKRVDNSTGSAIVATPFANCIVISNSYMGVGANGSTWFTFVRYGTERTNVYSNAETR